MTQLTTYERQVADWFARARNEESRTKGFRPSYGSSGYGTDALAKHTVGARGEIGTAKLLNVFPNLTEYAEERARGSDLPGNVDVRSTHHRNGGLILHPDDRPDGRYVLVTVQDDTVTALGWAVGRTVQQREFWGEPQPGRPCFLKPRGLLRPMDDLLAVLAFDRYRDAWRTAAQGSLL